MLDTVSDHLATNVKTLRQVRGYTQQRASEIAEVPRPTWASLESGGANPTLAVLLRVAAALQVSVEELIGPPRARCRLYPADSIPTKKRGKVTVRKLLPDAIPGLELDRMELAVGARLVGVPHTPGTREYLTCEQGLVELTTAGETHRVRPGDVLVFPGDQNHSYRNPGRSTTIAYSAVALAPAGT